MLSFAEVESFVRKQAMVRAKTLITPATQFEEDLGITGDDGVELLEAAEKHFHVSFDNEKHTFREVFGLAEDEFLFNGEGVSFSSPWPISIFRLNPVVRPFSVGEFYVVLSKLQAESEKSASI